MKYAKFVNTKPVGYHDVVRMTNMGDSVQAFAVDHLFRYAGVNQNDVIGIPCRSAEAEEPCYLVVQGHFGRQYDMGFMHNDNIYPIFIGFALKDVFLTDEEVRYFKKYEPILCRDELTKNTLTGYGVEAYLSGCLSVCFPKRDQHAKGKRDKYYFVDVKKPFLDLVPENIKQNAVYTSQNLYMDEVNVDSMERGDQMAWKLIKEYSDNAKMVITSRLHCMTPCMAMGIPTIAVGNNFSHRYSFVDAFLESYDEEQFAGFDWSIPKGKADVEEVKELLLCAGKSMLARNPDMDKIKRLDQFYSNRNRWLYCKGIKKELKTIFNGVERPEYILWGASSGGFAVYEALRDLWPNQEMVAIVDSYAEGIFGGKVILKPEEAIVKNPNAIVIISTMSGLESAEELLQKLDKKRDRDYFVVHENKIGG